MRLNVQFTWRLGGTGQPVTFTTTPESGDYLRDMWERIDRAVPGPARSALLRELTFLMDLFAQFGGAFVEEGEDQPAPPPAYLTRADSEPDASRQREAGVSS